MGKAIVPLALAGIAAATIVGTGGAAAPAVAPGIAGSAGAYTTATAAGAGAASGGGLAGLFSSGTGKLLLAGTGLQAASIFSQANQANVAGKAQQNQADFIAAQMEQQAKTEQAISQRRAIDIARQGRFLESRALAVGAASGAGVSNPGYMDVVSDLTQEIELRRQLALSSGESTAVGLQTGAEARRRSGRYDRQVGSQRSTQTLLEGGAGLALGPGLTMYERYG